MILNRFGLLDGTDNDAVTGKYGGDLSNLANALTTTASQTLAALGDVDRDRGLNTQGKATRMRALRETGTKEIRRLAAADRTRLKRELEAARQKIPNKVGASRSQPVDPLLAKNSEIAALTDAVAELRATTRASTIWSFFANLPDPVERAARLMVAAENGDGELLQAMQEAPRALGLVSTGDLEAAVTQYWRRVKPDELAAIEVIEQAIGVVDYNENMAVKAIANEGVAPVVTEPVAV